MSQEPVPFAYPDASAQYVPTIVPPPPPRLGWGWVLLLTIITFGIFAAVWLFVQALWVKRVSGRSVSFAWALVYLAWVPVAFVIGVICGVMAHAQTVLSVQEYMELPNNILRLVGSSLYLVAVFVLKSELEREPIDLSLGGVMTFFFGTIYFQSQLSKYGKESETFSGSASGFGLNGAAPIAQEKTEYPGS